LNYSKTLSPQETRDEQALFEALEARVAPQLEDVKVGIATDQPRVQAIRAADPRLANAYMATNTAEEIAAMQPIARGLAEDVKIQTYQQLLPDFKGGKAILRVLPMGAVATAAFTVADIAQAAQGVSDVQAKLQSHLKLLQVGLEAVLVVLSQLLLKSLCWLVQLWLLVQQLVQYVCVCSVILNVNKFNRLWQVNAVNTVLVLLKHRHLLNQ
jgi:hypothetical protein